MTRVTRIMTPGTLIFASAMVIGILAIGYFRPEIIGTVFGSLVVTYAFRTFRARGESTPLVRFFLGDIRSNSCYTSLEKILT